MLTPEMILEGTVTTGGVVSCTFTVKLLLAAPTKFVAVQVTVDCPKGKVAPDAGLQVVAREPLESIADVMKLTMLPLGPVASVTMGVGTDTTGSKVLSTVTVKLALVVPVELVAEQVTGLVPTGKVVPDSGIQVAGRVLPLESVAVTVNGTLLLDPAVYKLMLAGKFTVGLLFMGPALAIGAALDPPPPPPHAEKKMKSKPVNR